MPLYESVVIARQDISTTQVDTLGDELTVAWEIEPGREVVPATQLPAVTPANWDDPQQLGAFPPMAPRRGSATVFSI